MTNLILIGGGGHCKSCIGVIELTGQYVIKGILDVSQKVGQQIVGYDVIGIDAEIQQLSEQNNLFLITVGHVNNVSTRKRIFEKLVANGARLATVISPHACVSRDTILGDGTILMNGVNVNMNVTIGRNNIMNTGSIIEHDVRIGDHCHISTQAVINGNCEIKNDVFVGSNAVLVNNINVCSSVFIGAGAVVNKDIREPGTYVGNPARKIK
ncbi:MAG: acetyltransferase [Flavitalea sp.]